MGGNTCAFGLKKLSINITAMKKGDLLTMQMYSSLQIPLKEVKDFLREARMGEVK